MDYRTLGRTGLRVGALGFGCGNVGGLLIRGTPAERERAVARALELGINYFDTAPIYGDGQSETNLGQVIRALAAGALSGTEARHPIAVPAVDPIASAPEYAVDVRRARMLEALVEDGHAESLVEASLRFALTSGAVSTVLLGYSSLEHLEYA